MLWFAWRFGLPNQVVIDAIRKNGSFVDSISMSAQLGRLDIISIILGGFGLLLGVGALAGFWMVRREAIAGARDVAPAAVSEYMSEQASGLIRECLSDSEIAASLHSEILRLGLRDAADADQVDTDAEKKETENDAPDG